MLERTLLDDIKFATELADGMAVSNKILLAVLALVAKGQVKLSRRRVNVDPNLGHVVSHEGILTVTFVTDAEPEGNTDRLDPNEFPVEVNCHRSGGLDNGLTALQIMDDVYCDTDVVLHSLQNLVEWCVEQVPEEEYCTSCRRPVDTCRSEPVGFEDRWNYRTESHYTVDAWCDNAESESDFDEPDFDEPDDDDGYYADQAADAYERSLGGGW